MRLTVLMLAMLLASPAVAATQNPAGVANAVIAICSVAEISREGGEGQPRVQLMFTHGPPPGTTQGRALFQGQEFELVVRDGPSGFCALRMAPTDKAVLQAEFDRRFGPGTVVANGAATVWSIARTDGAGQLAYIPYAAGRSGPLWVGEGGYRFGFDSADERDTLVFYAPGQH